MYRSYHFPLSPSASQIRDLEKLFKIGKDFWNFILTIDNDFYSVNKKSLNQSELSKIATIYKNSSENFRLVHSHIYQVIVDNFVKSKKEAFRKFKSKETKNLQFPKLKNEIKSLKFKEYGNGCKITGNKVKFNHLNIKFDNHQNLKLENIKTVQIKKSYNKYYLIVVCDVKNEKLDSYHSNILNQYSDHVYTIDHNRVIKNNNVVGIDLGVANLATCSNGKVFKNPKFIKKYEKDLVRLQKKYQGQIKNSKRYFKTRVLYQKKHDKINNLRKDYLHKVSKELVLTCETIVLENLNIKKMLENDRIYSRLKKYIADSSWNKLYFYLKYKCEKYGKKLELVNPEYTSQKCSECGRIVKKELSDRVHKCSCGLEIDRDLNSSINLVKRYLGSERTFDENKSC